MTGIAPRWVAFYLPQFYPTAENDRWWGRGFTEWTNVARARPRFRGHEQPHLPADLGYYDLRVPETRAAQAAMAADHGISAFCYHHYWSGGDRLLSLPFEQVLRSGEPRFPFLLCWANHDWTRAWDGASGTMLRKQQYSPEDDLAHIRWLAEAFSDDRYLTVRGRPVFLVLHASQLPDAKATADRWRAEASRLGVAEPYLIQVEMTMGDRVAPERHGFDATVEFPPVAAHQGGVLLAPGLLPFVRRTKALNPGRDSVLRYSDVVDAALRSAPPSWKRYRCVVPRWDNSPRRQTLALVLHGSTPAQYRRWVDGVGRRFVPFGPDEDLVFVNAWNEWGEGAHLEPDQRWGLDYLLVHSQAERSSR